MPSKYPHLDTFKASVEEIVRAFDEVGKAPDMLALSDLEATAGRKLATTQREMSAVAWDLKGAVIQRRNELRLESDKRLDKVVKS